MKPSISEILATLPHKTGVNRNDWLHVKHDLLNIALWVRQYCAAKHLPLVITSIIRPKIEGVSVSDTHAEGRAFDISSRAFSVDDIDDILIECNRAFAKTIGAISSHDGLPRAVIYEFQGFKEQFKATEYLRENRLATPHLHFQVRRDHA